jgi:uncharacterized protein (DUF2237 family)
MKVRFILWQGSCMKYKLLLIHPMFSFHRIKGNQSHISKPVPPLPKKYEGKMWCFPSARVRILLSNNVLQLY